jgi:hypothetical protein
MPLGDLNNGGLGRALGREVLRQPLPQQPGMGPDNAVFAAVIPRRAMKNMHSNLLFRGRFGRAFERAVSNVKKKFPEA